jgi:hypothetical protein
MEAPVALWGNKVEWMEVSERAHVSASPEVVWRFVASAQAIPLYTGALRGYHDPDTPVGEVGERHCIEYLVVVTRLLPSAITGSRQWL